jgi:hypothetical protein
MPRLTAQVLDPLARGESARYAPYDWALRRFGAPRTLEPGPAILVEGVGAGRAALRPRLAALLWMERDAAGSWERGRRRDGPGLSSFWDGWTRAEAAHFAADPSRPYAAALVREVAGGHELAAAPDGALSSSATPRVRHRTFTQRDHR